MVHYSQVSSWCRRKTLWRAAIGKLSGAVYYDWAEKVTSPNTQCLYSTDSFAWKWGLENHTVFRSAYQSYRSQFYLLLAYSCCNFALFSKITAGFSHHDFIKVFGSGFWFWGFFCNFLSFHIQYNPWKMSSSAWFVSFWVFNGGPN